MWVETAPSAKGDTKRQQAAWRFISFVGSAKGSAAYLSAMKMSSALKTGSDKAKFDALIGQKASADLWFKGADALSVDKTFIAMIDDAGAGRKTNQDALNSAASSVTKILQASKIKWSTAAARSAMGGATE
jgi:ABC-type glycerol-3-phosphate transport system substrate-binding protein